MKNYKQKVFKKEKSESGQTTLPFLVDRKRKFPNSQSSEQKCKVKIIENVVSDPKISSPLVSSNSVTSSANISSTDQKPSQHFFDSPAKNSTLDKSKISFHFNSRVNHL